MSRFWHHYSPHRRILFILGGIVVAFALAFLFGFFVMLLWNWIMPDIFGLPTISYWQGWGLVLLAHILFKIGGGPNHGRHHVGDREWKERFRSRFCRPEPDQEGSGTDDT